MFGQAILESNNIVGKLVMQDLAGFWRAWRTTSWHVYIDDVLFVDESTRKIA
jgi:hypothetical protein